MELNADTLFKFDTVLQDGRMTDPYSKNALGDFDIRGAMNYCKNKGRTIEHLTDEELKQFKK